MKSTLNPVPNELTAGPPRPRCGPCRPTRRRRLAPCPGDKFLTVIFAILADNRAGRDRLPCPCAAFEDGVDFCLLRDDRAVIFRADLFDLFFLVLGQGFDRFSQFCDRGAEAGDFFPALAHPCDFGAGLRGPVRDDRLIYSIGTARALERRLPRVHHLTENDDDQQQDATNDSEDHPLLFFPGLAHQRFSTTMTQARSFGPRLLRCTQTASTFDP